MVFAQPHVHDSVNALDLCEIVGISGSSSSWSYDAAWFGVDVCFIEIESINNLYGSTALRPDNFPRVILQFHLRQS